MKAVTKAILLLLFSSAFFWASAQENCDNPECLTTDIGLSMGVDHFNGKLLFQYIPNTAFGRQRAAK
ncbi:hypothetical protein [Lewinella cohaerens]|uniref:hypothetical protein n=1 Tax=Lewinella cohaerens TaxID=70995 RepID=UPI0003672506|nr:hypothetical protein [Lewinella cohaerens]